MCVCVCVCVFMCVCVCLTRVSVLVCKDGCFMMFTVCVSQSQQVQLRKLIKGNYLLITAHD